MTEWALIALFGIPSAAVLGGSLTALWIALGKEPYTPGSQPRSVRYLAERKNRKGY